MALQEHWQHPLPIQPSRQSGQYEQDIEQLASTHQLGALISRHVTCTGTTQAMCGKAFIILPLFYALTLAVLFLRTTTLTITQLQLYSGPALAILVLGVFLKRTAPTRAYTGAVVYQGGLISLQTRSRDMLVVPWNQVESVWKTIERNNEGYCRLASYSLRLFNGRTLDFPRQLPFLSQLGQTLEREITGLRLPAALALYHAGQPVTFGNLTVTRQGLSIDNDQRSLPWHALKSLTAQRSSVTIMCYDRVLPWSILSFNQVPNACVLEALVHEIHNQ